MPAQLSSERLLGRDHSPRYTGRARPVFRHLHTCACSCLSNARRRCRWRNPRAKAACMRSWRASRSGPSNSCCRHTKYASLQPEFQSSFSSLSEQGRIQSARKESCNVVACAPHTVRVSEKDSMTMRICMHMCWERENPNNVTCARGHGNHNKQEP